MKTFSWENWLEEYFSSPNRIVHVELRNKSTLDITVIGFFRDFYSGEIEKLNCMLEQNQKKINNTEESFFILQIKEIKSLKMVVKDEIRAYYFMLY